MLLSEYLYIPTLTLSKVMKFWNKSKQVILPNYFSCADVCSCEESVSPQLCAFHRTHVSPKPRKIRRGARPLHLQREISRWEGPSAPCEGLICPARPPKGCLRLVGWILGCHGRLQDHEGELLHGASGSPLVQEMLCTVPMGILDPRGHQCPACSERRFVERRMTTSAL